MKITYTMSPVRQTSTNTSPQRFKITAIGEGTAEECQAYFDLMGKNKPQQNMTPAQMPKKNAP